MAQSFESILIDRGSKDNFKKAKALLKNGGLVCCNQSTSGTLRAVFRDARNMVSRVEVSGFPAGPYTASCTCTSDKNDFCQHAVAACLHHAKYTIKPQEVQTEDTPAIYAGLRFYGLPELLNQVLEPPTAQVFISSDSEFPHMPSKWERIEFEVSLHYNGRVYSGNLNNLRQLNFGKNLSVSLRLETFPQQDRQIIRYLAINARTEGAKLSLDAEGTAEFFHCLIGFQRFFRQKENVVIHKAHADPAILVEDAPGGCILRSAIIVEGAPLPLKDVKVIAGRAGCWLGMLGEYWWISAQADVLWLRNFLRTTVQPCDKRSAQILLAATWLPVTVIESRKLKVAQKKFRPFYDGKLKPDGSMEIELSFDYNGCLCPGDHERYASFSGLYWLRDTSGENACAQQLINFGFSLKRSAGRVRRTRLQLSDHEAVGVFVNEVIPQWIREGKDFILSSELSALCGDAASLHISCKIAAQNDNWFDLAVSLESGGMPILWKDLVEASVHNELFMSAGTGSFIKIPSKLRALAAGMADIVKIVPSPHLKNKHEPFSETLRIVRPAAYHWARLADGIPGAMPNEFLSLKNDLELTLEELAGNTDGLKNAGVFKGELRHYQVQGVRWLSAMEQRGFNLILADEMGLGKTIQTLALLGSDATDNLPALVICPTSLLENWAREAARFIPECKLIVISGNDRASLWEKSKAFDICVTSYSLIRRDVELLKGRSFKYLILDEAQHIKNPTTANAHSCNAIIAEHKLVLTGTPLENSPEDLWSIFEFLHPGILGTLTSFKSHYITGTSLEIQEELANRISPFMLRRKKIDVALELPPKQEQVLCCEMGPAQRLFYDRLLESSRELLTSVNNESASAASRFEILSSLLRLRQVCCAPELLPDSMIGQTEAPASAKLDLLKEVLMESLDSGHKVLVFSQFTSMLEIMRKWMDSCGLAYEYLDGSTTDRMQHVDHFNSSPEIQVFLLSLKAGGVGLNLTSADTVIIYDPWWNPAVEAQAEDRTHRIGQTRSVSCIKLIVKNSIEEKVLELQKQKASLFENLVESPTEAMRNISMDDLEFLLK